MNTFINNKQRAVKRVVIVGGGTAGWMSAMSFARYFRGGYCEVVLVESEDIGTVGVGEATIPQIQVFNKIVGLDENEFVKRTQASFKLGIEFVNWGQIGDSYLHAFGGFGRDMEGLHFHHYWLKYHKQGGTQHIGEYCLNAMAAKQNKFMRSVEAGNSPLSNIAYAFHFDAGLYARYLRELAEKAGVKRIEGRITKVNLRESDGFIESVTLERGETISGDLFIDCSGFRGLLINEALGVGYVDWSQWLPNDSAWAVPSEKITPLPSYTRATAHKAGWQWRIPLQHRTGNGHVFSSRFMEAEEAKEILLNNLTGKALAEPRLIRFKTGRREKFWEKNCIAIGLSSGFMEPLESTSIHLVQSALARILTMFPYADFNQKEIDLYNEQVGFEYERIRDFIILHYKATHRDDSEYWRYCKDMDVPEELQKKIDVFMQNGQMYRFNNELFNEVSWVEVLLGQGFIPEGYHPLVDAMPEEDFVRRMKHIKDVLDSSVACMPDHLEFINQNCKAEMVKSMPIKNPS